MPPISVPGLEDRLFGVLTGSVFALLVVAVSFSIIALALRARHNRVARIWKELEAKWEPVLLEVLVGEEPVEHLTRLVAPGEGLRFLDYLLRFARRVSGDETAVLGTLARPFLPRLAEQLDRGDPEQRARAIQTLGVLGLPEYLDLVRTALDDPSPLVSMIAAQSLAEPESPEFTPQILERLDRYTDWHPAFVAGLLSGAGSGANPYLRKALLDDSRSPDSRAIVAFALENLRDPEAADTAATVLAGTDDPNLAVACLRLIVEVGEGRHHAAVLPLLDSPHFHLRSYSLKALRAVGGPDDVGRFERALDDESPWVAVEAARGLRELGASDTLERLALSGGERATLARQVISE